MFSEMDFSTALKSFALLDRSPEMEDLKAEALRGAQKSPLNAMMGIKHIDDEGKTVVNTAGAGIRGATRRLVPQHDCAGGELAPRHGRDE